MAALAFSASADQVVLKNGDRISGAIVKQDGKSITVKTDDLGVTAAPWDQVTSVTTEQSLYVVLPDGRTVQGMATTAGGALRVAAAAGAVDVPLASVKALRNADEQRAYDRLLDPNLLQLWTVSGSLGLAGASGSAGLQTRVSAPQGFCVRGASCQLAESAVEPTFGRPRRLSALQARAPAPRKSRRRTLEL